MSYLYCFIGLTLGGLIFNIFAQEWAMFAHGVFISSASLFSHWAVWGDNE